MISYKRNANRTYSMTAMQIKNCLAEHNGTFVFDYQNKRYGIEPYCDSELEIWHEDKSVIVYSLDEIMTIPFFDGKSLTEIADEIEIESF